MFDVREATAADRPHVEALIAEMIPGCDVAARMRWLYESNPGGPAITWLAVAATGEVAGCTSFFPFRLWLDGEEKLGALGGDGYVRPAFRRRGIGALLHKASRDAMPRHDISCMYGAPGAMNVTPLKHGGSRESGQVVRWVRPLRGEALHVPAPLASAVAWALKPRPRARLVPAVANDPRIDGVWEAARGGLRLAAIRDGAFYTWRFQNAPAGRQPTFVIIDHDRPIGACALEPIDGGRILRIVDLLAVPGEWRTCLLSIVDYCTATSAELVDIKLLERDSQRRSMYRSLFVDRGKKPFLCMIPPGGDRRFVDPKRWFYTNADSDLDDHT
ncbi:MAG: GNAT family N-acetyltransferase [Deltaproteobacteria bacterium]|nr:GNAT family N-acetyltransferase [Deltaproteobacteria bacterium]